MNSILQRVTTISLFTLLSACASDLDLRNQALESGACCLALKDLPVVTVEPKKLVWSRLWDTTTTFKFSDGRAIALLFDLHDSRKERTVVLKSYPYNEWSNQALLCPMITFLDKDFLPIGKFEENLQHQTYDETERKEWTIEFAVPEMARSLVIHPKQEEMGRTKHWMLPRPIFPLFNPFYDGRRHAICRDRGSFDVLLK